MRLAIAKHEVVGSKPITRFMDLAANTTIFVTGLLGGLRRNGLFVGGKRRAQSMRFRHSAMLALIGWILLTPPIASVASKWNDATKENEPYTNAPLSQWQTVLTFDTADECRAELANQNAQIQVKCPTCVALAECVAADDPRLKAK
jgi:hypothetical protein